MTARHAASQRWRHQHDFLADLSASERRTRWVMALTAATMVVEIAAGTFSGSMALLADGWHMATHVAAFGIAIYAYRYARRHAADPRFTFGTGKVMELGGFASALALAFVALAMAVESTQRLLEPRAIAFDEALWVAALGLAVNVASALLLARGGHGHAPHTHDHAGDHDDHDDHDDHEHGHEDHNLRAAYLHVIADALTSVLAIAALAAGKFAGWTWLDPVMGLVGAALILRWAYGLVRVTASVLLDGVAHDELRSRLQGAIENHPEAMQRGDSVTDLHVWAVAPGRLAATIAVVAHDPDTPAGYRARLAALPGLAHVVIEVNRCDDPRCSKEHAEWSP
jgi:cation diffusion facilitator family transporter